MKVSMFTAVGLLVVTFAFWIGRAEARYGGGKGRPAPAHPVRAGGRPNVARPHPAQPKAKAQHKAKAATAKPAQKKKKPKELAHAKHDEKKKHPAKEKAREHAKKAAKKVAKKALAKTKAGHEPDPESISLLRAAHQKLHQADHDYDGHRHRAIEHVGSALHHLGSSAEGPMRSGGGHANSPQSVSDAVMHEARNSLETIKHRLAANSAAGAGHREAHRAVDAAIREIGLALRVR